MSEFLRKLSLVLVMIALHGCSDDLKADDAGAADAGSIEQAPNVSGPRFCWVGAVEDTDVQVALLIGPGKARLFFCGGADSYATTTRWFNVAHDGGEHVEFEQDSWRIHAHLLGNGFIGEIVLGDGVTRKLQAQRTDPATLAGLYEGTAGCGRVGLIVTQDMQDAVPKAQGACISDTSAGVETVDAVAPLASEAGKIRVRAPDQGDATLLLQAATLDPL